MAKGRKHGSDRNGRLLGTYGYGHGHVSVTDLPDLREEDVWSSAGRADNQASNNRDDAWSSSGGERSDEDRSSQDRRWLGRSDRQVGGLSLAFEDACQTRPTVLYQHRNADGQGARGSHRAAASSPVNVPDWARILRVGSSESMQGGGEVEGDDGEWVPPHEYVAREHGGLVTTSVFEGVGRTLKGRDMSRVRDAVWSQTGFFG